MEKSNSNRNVNNHNNNMQFLYSAFLVDAGAKRFTYYYPWQTCYISHLLNSLGSAHPLTRFKAPPVIFVQLPSLSIARYSFTTE